MRKRILVTNDDGIRADGIIRLASAARDFGEVWVVAPERQRSAASHGITLHSHIDVMPCSDFPVEGVRAFSCSGTPADCVRAGSLAILPQKPDLVLSGINCGYNVASDIQYSGTVGAAFEGWFQGIPAIALSEDKGEDHEVTDVHLSAILAELIGADAGANRIWNVNFPACPLSELRGILRDREVSHQMFFKDNYKVQEELPEGGIRLVVDATYGEKTEEGTDMRAVVEKYISIGRVNNIGYA